MKKAILSALCCLGSFAMADTMMVEVSVKHGVHEVTKTWTVDGDFADTTSEVTNNGLNVQLWRDEFPLESFIVKNPTHVNSPLSRSGDVSRHDRIELDEFIYHLKLPASLNATHVTVDHLVPARSAVETNATRSEEVLYYKF